MKCNDENYNNNNNSKNYTRINIAFCIYHVLFVIVAKSWIQSFCVLLSLTLALSMCVCMFLRASIYVWVNEWVWHTVSDVFVSLCVDIVYNVHVNELAWVNKRLLKNRFDMYAVAVAIVSNKVYMVFYSQHQAEYNVCQNHSTHSHRQTPIGF